MATLTPAIAEDRASLLSVQSVAPGPDTLTSSSLRLKLYCSSYLLNRKIKELVKRLRALTLQLLPVEVSVEEIKNPTSRVITLQVIAAYKAAAGDFLEAVCSHSFPLSLFNTLIQHVGSFHTVSCEQGPSSYGILNTILLIMEITWDAVSSISFLPIPTPF
jgi:hypothetical protein